MRRCILETSCSPPLAPVGLKKFLGGLPLIASNPTKFGQNPSCCCCFGFFGATRDFTRVYLANAAISRVQRDNIKCSKFYLEHFLLL